MIKIITGYQYGDRNLYIGTYKFENNLDKTEIHLPPNTTLIAPPTNVPVDQEIVWNGTTWVLQNISMYWIADRVIDDITSMPTRADTNPVPIGDIPVANEPVANEPVAKEVV